MKRDTVEARSRGTPAPLLQLGSLNFSVRLLNASSDAQEHLRRCYRKVSEATASATTKRVQQYPPQSMFNFHSPSPRKCASSTTGPFPLSLTSFVPATNTPTAQA